jgi:hypothetical protein
MLEGNTEEEEKKENGLQLPPPASAPFVCVSFGTHLSRDTVISKWKEMIICTYQHRLLPFLSEHNFLEVL